MKNKYGLIFVLLLTSLIPISSASAELGFPPCPDLIDPTTEIGERVCGEYVECSTECDRLGCPVTQDSCTTYEIEYEDSCVDVCAGMAKTEYDYDLYLASLEEDTEEAEEAGEGEEMNTTELLTLISSLAIIIIAISVVAYVFIKHWSTFKKLLRVLRHKK